MVVLPKTKTLTQLEKLNDKQLFDYFTKNSRYLPFPHSDEQSYAIQAGPLTLYSNDTMDLRIKFFDYIRKG